MSKAKFIHNDDLQKMIAESGTEPRGAQGYVDLIASKHPWCSVVAFVDAGIIAFDTQSCYNGWFSCQG